MRDHRFRFVRRIPERGDEHLAQRQRGVTSDTPVAREVTLPRNSDGAESGPAKGGEMQALEDGRHRARGVSWGVRRSRTLTRTGQIMAAGLTIAAASMGIGGVPAQAAGGTPSISAGPNVVVGEADGSVTIPVTLSASSSEHGDGRLRHLQRQRTLQHRLLGQLHLSGPRDHRVELRTRRNHTERDHQPLELPTQPFERVLHLLPEPLQRLGSNDRRQPHPGRCHGERSGARHVRPLRQERRGRRQRRHGPGARRARWAFGLGPGSGGHGQLHDRRWFSDCRN